MTRWLRLPRPPGQPHGGEAHCGELCRAAFPQLKLRKYLGKTLVQVQSSRAAPGSRLYHATFPRERPQARGQPRAPGTAALPARLGAAGRDSPEVGEHGLTWARAPQRLVRPRTHPKVSPRAQRCPGRGGTGSQHCSAGSGSSAPLGSPDRTPGQRPAPRSSPVTALASPGPRSAPQAPPGRGRGARFAQAPGGARPRRSAPAWRPLRDSPGTAGSGP